jgi:uncharacterized repeat protein (TIGR01451 family)
MFRSTMRRSARGATLLLVFAMLATLVASYAVDVSAATTTVQIGSGFTAPQSGLLLSGSGTNPATGTPWRHIWYGDFANGLCRIDPDVDTINANLAAGLPGGGHLNTNTCVHFVADFAQLKPGELTMDPRPSAVEAALGVPNAHDLYVVDLQANSQGIVRMHFLPDGDSGQGVLDLTHEEVLGGSPRFGGGCGIPGNAPNTGVLGPDGNLYVGFKRSGNIVRVVAPQTEPLPCSNVQVMGQTQDGKKDFGLAWIGHDLYGDDGNSPWTIANADQCFTSTNNFVACHGISVLGGLVVGGLTTVGDQNFNGTPTPFGQPVVPQGRNIYFGTANSATKVQILPNQQVIANYGGASFQFLSGIIVDTTNPGNETLYVGDDPVNGFNPGQGRFWEITNTVVPAPPAAPMNVTATAGDTTASVSWTDGGPGSQPTTSYTVRTLTPTGTATAIPDLVVRAPAGQSAPPTGATVTGLTNGTSYEFVVDATNSVGSSPFSAPSNVVTPHAVTVPGAPTGVSAQAGNAGASVAWTAPANNGGSAITSYTVKVLANGVATGQTVSAPGSATGATVTGLTNGTSYTFTVSASNVKGAGPDSAPSNAVTPTAGAVADLALAMSGPTSVNSGANAVYTMTVTNNSTVTTAPDVQLTDTPPATGATFVSLSSSQGAPCVRNSTINCNLGSLGPLASATVTLTLNVTANVTNSATVAEFDATGAQLTDPAPANNSASVSTSITAPAGDPTDLQVTGSAQNGGPAVGSSDTYTWQIKNALGTVTANNVTFTDTLPPGLVFQSVNTSAGTCSAPAAGSSGGTITCTAPTLGGGQTMIVTVNVGVPQAGSIANTGSATMANQDTNPANNSFTVTIQAK